MLFKKPTVWLALLGFVLLGAMIVRDSKAVPQPKPPLPLPVKPFAHCIGASGIVESRQKDTLIGATVPGLILEVYVKPWDTVVAGDRLFQLDDRDLRAQLLVDEAQVKLKEATLAMADDQYQRVLRVGDKRAVSEEERADRQLQVGIDAADLGAARAACRQQQALIDRMLVHAPIAGTVLQVNNRAGEYVSSFSTTAPIVLGNITDLWCRADIDEQVAPRVKPGEPAVGYLKGSSTDPIPMDFVWIEPYVIPKEDLTGAGNERVDTRVLQVIYQFHNPVDRRIYAGQQMDLFVRTDP
jgi:HlyD family secretion protein